MAGKIKSGVTPRGEAPSEIEATQDVQDSMEVEETIEENKEIELPIDELAADISNFKVALDNLVEHNNELIRTLAKRNKSTYRLVEVRRHLQTIQRMLKPM